MRILKTNGFSEFANDESITDETLRGAVKEIEAGLTGDSLGSSVHKKRIARPGQGKSGGFRTIIAFRKKDRVIFIHGYAKNQVSTLKPKELKAVRKAAKEMLNWTDEEVDELVKQDVLQEIKDGQE